METQVSFTLTNLFILMGLILPAFISIGMLFQRSKSHTENFRILFAYHDEMLKCINNNTKEVSIAISELRMDNAIMNTKIDSVVSQN